MKIFCLFLILALGYHLAHAQVEDSTQSTKNQKKISIIPLPAIASNPTNGWMFGVAPGASWYMGDKETTHISSGLGTLIYTTKKQWIITAKTNMFLANDSWNLLGDWRYFITSQPTYGLGTESQSKKNKGTGVIFEDNTFSQPIPDKQMMDFDYLRFHETVLKRYHQTPFYFGLGYHLDYHHEINDRLLDLDTIPPLLTSHYIYSEKTGFSNTEYILSGISINSLYDSRDNSINPYHGRYAFVNVRMNPTFLGSDQASSLLWAEYRDYLNLSKKRPRHMLAFWAYGWFVTSGNVPYLDLPAVGWDQFGRSGRAYTQGRFRGENVVYAETEYRVPLQKTKDTFGAVAFINATTASSRYDDINLFEHLSLGYGAGLRVMINKKSRANLNIDVAWGEGGAAGFYFGINEAF
ncbi:outer membrane protein assembly factor [Reichenbachiella agarivorans]|uniref:Outer membrane protein assembly factor n=1 Tax=Reichenbachiella agarivorans TaxID=2979464 RepID=A0ABY6CSE7_9BACT|nr:outer membrane protein assembly factor [Reichenbachiella agarivorans]UXP33442.1 outer membrane protein assembly factor [Reichenbachiella agarivorans]